MKRFNLLAGITISALALSAGMATGATRTWLSTAVDHDWDNPLNWNQPSLPATLPASGDDIIIQSISNYPIFTSGTWSNDFGDVTLEAGARFDISDPIRVDNLQLVAGATMVNVDPGADLTIDVALDMESGSTVNAEASVTTLDATVGEASGSLANLNIIAGSSDPFTVSGKMTVEVTGTVNVGSNATSDIGVLVLTQPASTADALEVQSSGHIQVEVSMSKLEFDAGGSDLTATIDGSIEFQNSGMLFAVDSVELEGLGSATLGSDATFQVAAGKTLTNNLAAGVIANNGSASIVGQMAAFMTPGKFDNQSVVTANATLSLASSTVLVDADPTGSEWIASGSGSQLIFGRSHSGASKLAGDFLAEDGGVIHFATGVTIETDGDLVCGSFGDPGLVEACGAHFWVNGSVPSLFPTSPQELNDNRFECGTGLLNDCP